MGATVLSVGMAEAEGRSAPSQAPATVQLVSLTPQAPLAPPTLPAPEGPTFEGLDLDGDGAPDFANPTGHAPRGHDRFGDGYFHAGRDGGARAHEGVDYDARPGQPVVAPISGYVARIGYAYPGDERFKYVEIENPALHVEARVFYVDPSVNVGDTVALGKPIGRAHSLQARYRGITDHVHLEIAEAGRKIDAQTVILARGEGSAVMAAMN